MVQDLLRMRARVLAALRLNARAAHLLARHLRPTSTAARGAASNGRDSLG